MFLNEHTMINVYPMIILTTVDEGHGLGLPFENVSANSDKVARGMGASKNCCWRPGDGLFLGRSWLSVINRH